MAELEGSELLRLALRGVADAGAAQADAVFVQGDGFEVRVRDRNVDFVRQSRGRTLGIRALVKQVTSGEGYCQAVTSTSDLSPDAVKRMAAETVALASATAADPTAGLPSEAFSRDLPELELFDAADRNVSVEARIEDARAVEAAARAVDARINNSEGSEASSHFNTIYYANSEGFEGSYETATQSLFGEPLAIEGEQKQRDYWMTVGHKLADLESPEIVGQKAATRALRRLNARSVATCEVPVIFEPRTAPSLLGHVSACLNGYAVYRKSSFLAGRLGEKIGSDCITIIDDGRLPGGLGSKPFDGEGLATRRNLLLEEGVIQSYLLDSYSGRKLGMSSTGSAARGATSAPSAGTTNLWLEPGEATPEEIIGSVDRGLLVTELIGMGFNPVTGDYSRGAVGFWIEKGELAYPVEEITIAGNLGQMLASIDAVGNDLLWLGRTAAPTLRVAKMTVAGNG